MYANGLKYTETKNDALFQFLTTTCAQARFTTAVFATSINLRVVNTILLSKWKNVQILLKTFILNYYPCCCTIVVINEKDTVVWCKLHCPSRWQLDFSHAWNIRVKTLGRSNIYAMKSSQSPNQFSSIQLNQFNREVPNTNAKYINTLNKNFRLTILLHKVFWAFRCNTLPSFSTYITVCLVTTMTTVFVAKWLADITK